MSARLVGRAALALPLLVLLPPEGAACSRTSDCAVAHGRYRVSVPAGWDGTSRLPAALYFHGWQQGADHVMADKALVEAFSALGILLVAPDGLGRTWTFPGAPSQARDDVAFALSVLTDMERRFPVDAARVWATGFSRGGSMAWWLACAGGRRFAAFAPVAGAFWEPLPKDCSAGPANILHTHGLSDGTVPMTGRVVGGRFRQGDVMAGVAVWRHVNGCTREEPDDERQIADMTCRRWTSCASGREVQLCLHPDGHEIRRDWIASAWAFVQRVADRSTGR
jgi:polyhydroxybutyrate depolymerase